jgi:opacity protein-like surface antigen
LLVKRTILTLTALATLSTASFAQERASITPVKDADGWTYLDVEDAAIPEVDSERALLPGTLSRPAEDDKVSPFSLGPSGGYLRVKDADRGTWFGGVQARLRLGVFAAEASITFHQNHYEDGDVVVTQFPLQLTAFLYIIPVGPIRPYVLGGVGWYRTRIDYSGVFSAIPDDHQNIFGEHLGAGAEVFLGPRVSLNADVRYIFLNPDTDQVIGQDFNYWQIAFGLNFLF